MDCDETGTAYDQEIAAGDDSARACREEQMGEPGEIDFETEKENVEGHENGRHSNQKDKERSKELDKPRSKDRRKSRREEKEQTAKDRDKSKPRDVEKGRDKDSEKHETKEKDRTTGKERRKDENGTSKRKDADLDYRRSEKHKEMSKEQETDYGRDRKEKEYNKDREHEKDREKERDKERQREKDRDRDRHRDKDRGRDTNREREHERGIERIQEHGKDREPKMDREIEREYDGGKERVKEHDRRKEQDKDRGRDRGREKEHDWKERERDMEKERERERDNDRDHEREKDRDREREKERDKAKDRERGKEKPKDREKERVKERDKERDRFENDKGKDKTREKDKEKDMDKIAGKDRDKERTKDKLEGKSKDRDYKEMNRVKDGEKDKRIKLEGGDIMMQVLNIHDNKKDHIQKTIQTSGGSHTSTSDLHARITKMKEDRLEKKTDGGSEILSWVNKSRKLEEKVNVEKEKALFLAKAFEEQDNVDQEESEDEEAQHTGEDLAGVKILHGLDKVIEGGAVVLTLKDQNILADGDINYEIDMLENVEIGEQKQRDEAYKAAKKSNKYDDKFGNDVDTPKTILPQYDDSKDEGITLDETGRFTGEAEKKLQELRKRLEGASTGGRFEDLTSTSKVSSDYYTQDEMLQFKKPKKKKSLRKKDKLDLAALEAEAISAGLGADDLGSRKGGHRESSREEQEKSDAKMRDSAYHLAYVKADEASKALRQEQTLVVQTNDDEVPVFGEDAEDLYKSMERARKLAFRKKDEAMVSHAEEIASLASADGQSGDTQNPGEPQENKVVFTEMMEFVWGLQLDEDAHKHEDENVPKDEDEDEVPKSVEEEEMNDVAGGWTEVKEDHEDELPINEEKEEVAPDETIHEVAVGKGLSGALQLLKERGTLKESIDWGGRNMDKKKSKLVGIRDNDGPKEIILDRLDEFGRIMTPKEAFRKLSHKFHGKGPGKMKQEKRMKQYEEELRLKQMNPSDTPLLSMEKMREAQAKLRSPFIMLNGQMKPGQTSDPRSGFATVEKDLPGSLTPMLGDRKVEHFLGIKRKAEPSNLGPPKKPKT